MIKIKHIPSYLSRKWNLKAFLFYYSIGCFMVRSYGFRFWFKTGKRLKLMNLLYSSLSFVNIAIILSFIQVLTREILLHFPDLHPTVILLLLVQHPRTEHSNVNWTCGFLLACIVRQKKKCCKTTEGLDLRLQSLHTEGGLPSRWAVLPRPTWPFPMSHLYLAGLRQSPVTRAWSRHLKEIHLLRALPFSSF